MGATLAVSEAGEVSGSVSGGCVEPAVVEEGLRTIRTGWPKLLTFGITVEQNIEQIGLSCGGEIRVFVERAENLAPVVAALRAEQPLVRAVVIAAPPESSTKPGTALVMGEDEAVTGTLGTAELDRIVGDIAGELASRGESAVRSAEVAGAPGVEIYFGVYNAPPLLVIVGAGHIAIPLTRMAKMLDYRVVVVDARAAFATRERLPEADEILIEWPDEALARVGLSSTSAVAVLTHDDKFDVPALRAALASPAQYVGAIGSRSTRHQRDKRLREVGVGDEQIARIHGPIGLDIGARTPAEIALAILAQIIASRRGRAE
jgi:xanthine dehydrogenase accessory factor